jgi:hypothetical protein
VQRVVRTVEMPLAAAAARLAAAGPRCEQRRNLIERFCDFCRATRGAGAAKESLFAPRVHRRRCRPGHSSRCAPDLSTRWQVGQTTGPRGPSSPPRQAEHNRHAPATIASRPGSNSWLQRRQVVVMMVMARTPSTERAGLDRPRQRTQNRRIRGAASERRSMPRSRSAHNCPHGRRNARRDGRARAQDHHRRRESVSCRRADSARPSRPSSGCARTRRQRRGRAAFRRWNRSSR